MTRRPACRRKETQPGCTQFTAAFEAKPCTSTIGSPSPSSRKAISTSSWRKLCMASTYVGARKIFRRAGPSRDRRCGQMSLLAHQCARLAAGNRALGRALDHAFGRGAEAEQRPGRREQPGKQIDCAHGEHDRSPAAELEHRAGLGAVALCHLRNARHLARPLRELEAIERGLCTRLGLYATHIA